MAIRVLSGTPTICMVMALSDLRECIQTSSRDNPSLAVPTQWDSSMIVEIMFEALKERIP